MLFILLYEQTLGLSTEVAASHSNLSVGWKLYHNVKPFNDDNKPKNDVLDPHEHDLKKTGSKA